MVDPSELRVMSTLACGQSESVGAICTIVFEGADPKEYVVVGSTCVDVGEAEHVGMEGETPPEPSKGFISVYIDHNL